MKIPLFLFLLVLSIFFTGCFSLGPKYVKPQVSLPESYTQQAYWKEAEPQDDVPKGEWWRIYQDDQLNQLQGRLVENNFDIRAAIARIDQARGVIKEAKSDLYPHLTVGFDATRIGESGQGRFFADRRTDNFFSLPFDLNYEIDLWGKFRNANDSALQNFESKVADYQHMVLSIQAELARTYFELRSVDSQISIVNNVRSLLEKSHGITKALFESGNISEIELSQARAQVVEIKIELMGLELKRTQLLNAIAVLLGKTDASFNLELNPLEGNVPTISSGLPSSLLERRADISSAQRLMAKANADIGYVQAARFPSISLTSSYGHASTELSDLFAWNARSWSVGPSINWPLFRGHRDKARRAQTEAIYQEQVANYRQIILNAFREVEDGLVAMRILDQQLDDFYQVYQLNQDIYESVVLKHNSGLVSMLDVIDAEINSLRAYEDLTNLNGQHFIASIILIKALGGHWQ